MPRELGVDRRGRADERHAKIEMPRGSQRAVDDVAWGVVAAHGVYCNLNHLWCEVRGARCEVRGCAVAPRTSHSARRTGALFLVDRPGLPSPVVPAVAADAMRRLGLMAVRAF